MNSRSTMTSLVVAACICLTWAGPGNAASVANEIETLVGGVTTAGTQANEEIAARVFVPELYALRGYRPAWDDTKAQKDLFGEIDRAISQGFRPEDFDLGQLKQLLETAQKSGRAIDIAAFDLEASDAAAKILHYSIFGKVDPAALDKDWNFTRPVLEQNPPEVVNTFLAGEGFSALMDRVVLQAPQYTELTKALAYYRQINADGGWPLVPDDEVLKPDMISPAVAALRYRLAAEFALNEGQVLPTAPETGENASWVYDPGLMADVMAFQARVGLEADGVIGGKTFRALNRTAAERVNQIRLSLERARWIMRDLDNEYVMVNIAGSRTYYVKPDQIWITRSVTGTQYRKTPVFRDNIQYMEFNPTWTVPRSIFLKDKLSRIRKDPGYLSRGGYVVKNSDGVVIPASAVNWGASNPPITLMQKPGDKNALGMVKFMFPNAHAVYLHDTENRDLFNRNERNLSSGCVRVEYPFEFASLLMEGAPDWSEAKMQAILASGKTTRVNLPKPVPVLLTYWTAWVEGEAVHFREDLYERDAPILSGLNR